MVLTRKEEFEKLKTCSGYTEEEILNNSDVHWSAKTTLKDVHGEASLLDIIALETSNFLGYNNIDYISKEEIYEHAEEILKIIENESIPRRN